MFRKASILLMLTAVCIAGLAGLASAANPDTFQITVTCQRTLSVNVTTATTDGAVSYTAAISSAGMYTGVNLVIPTPLYVWNDSLANSASIQNYRLSVTGGTGNLSTANWGTTGSGVADMYVLGALFTAVGQTAATTDFANASTEDCLTSGTKDWTATTIFSPTTAGERYANEAAHPRDSNLGAATLRLWVGVGTPSATSAAGSNVTFTVTVLAI
jgi:hypothetical protein